MELRSIYTVSKVFLSTFGLLGYFFMSETYWNYFLCIV